MGGGSIPVWDSKGGWSRKFTSPLVARCAMGFCKRGCADACVEFFLARLAWNLRRRLLLAVLCGFAKAVAPTLALKILGSLFFGGLQAVGKVRSREFTSPLVARCAMGFCKRGCADACVEFFLARYSLGVCKGWKVRSREFTSHLLLAVLWGFANAVAPTLALNFSWLVNLWGFASGWKVRSREFTSPLAARCAMGFCKGGCVDACVEFFLAR